MSGDYSRWCINSIKDYRAVLMQQGRVLTDADWNESVSILLRRIRVQTLDLLGPAAVPRVTPDGFRIAVREGRLSIGPGRIYIDGLLVENHGEDAAMWNPVLAERCRVADVDYAAQPYFPAAPPLPGGGHQLVYLKVWLREVTSIEAPDLVEIGLHSDTTTRMQMIWQVRLLIDPGPGIDCSTPLENIYAFNAAEPPAGGRLTTFTSKRANRTDDSLVPATGGYQGSENQLYRVEIHRSGGLDGTEHATFKWSRENASVCLRVVSIVSLKHLVVECLDEDKLSQFAAGDWVEITDDCRELHGLPGDMRRIQSVAATDNHTHALFLETPVIAGQFGVDRHGTALPSHNMRVRCWNQRGRVMDAAGSLLADLDQPGSDGTIPVQSGAMGVMLERGIVVRFDLASYGWMLPGR